MRARIVATFLCVAFAFVLTPATALAAPAPEDGYASYHKEYFINNLPNYTSEQLMSEFNSNVDGYFTFTGCGESLELYEVCELDLFYGGHAPVQVVSVESTGFTLMSLPGHPEGAYRYITFQFRPYDVVGNPTLKQLVVDAWGPVSGASILGPLNSETVAEYSWQTMADNINTRFPYYPTYPSGGIYV